MSHLHGMAHPMYTVKPSGMHPLFAVLAVLLIFSHSLLQGPPAPPPVAALLVYIASGQQGMQDSIGQQWKWIAHASALQAPRLEAV